MENLKGKIYVICSAILFGIMPILAKLSYESGSNVQSTLFLRFLFSSIIIYIYLKYKRILIKLNIKNLILVCTLGFLGYSLMSIFLFTSYNYMPVGVASMIFFIYPTIISCIEFIIFKEKITKRKTLSLVLSTIGIITIIGIGQSKIKSVGLMFVLLAALSYSTYVIGINTKAIRKINNIVIIFYVVVTCTITTGLMGVATNSINFKISYIGIIYILILSLISTVIPFILFLQGAKIIGSSNAAILGTLEPIVSLLLSDIFLDEKLNFRIIVGSVLVLISMALIQRNDMQDIKSIESENFIKKSKIKNF